MEQIPEKKASYTKNKRTHHYILWAAILLIFLAFFITGFTTDWFGLYGPVTKISIAGANTFTSQNFTSDFKMSNEKFYIEGTLQLSIDPECKRIEAYLEAVSGNTTYIAAIFDSKLLYGTQKHLIAKDIEPQLESYFQRSNNKSTKIRSIDDALELLFNIIPEDVQQKISESYFNLDTSKDLLKSFLFTKLNRTSWLKKHAAYKTYKIDGIRYHTFRTGKGMLLHEALEHFKSAFVNEILYNRLCESAQAMQDSASATETLIAIDGEFLRKYETITRSTNKTSYITIEFHSVGTTNIDREQLRELLQKANT